MLKELIDRENCLSKEIKKVQSEILNKLRPIFDNITGVYKRLELNESPLIEYIPSYYRVVYSRYRSEGPHSYSLTVIDKVEHVVLWYYWDDGDYFNVYIPLSIIEEELSSENGNNAVLNWYRGVIKEAEIKRTEKLAKMKKEAEEREREMFLKLKEKFEGEE